MDRSGGLAGNNHSSVKNSCKTAVVVFATWEVAVLLKQQ